MFTRLLNEMVKIRTFPAVVHPRHARELLSGGDAEAIAGWTGGYAITMPEHRFLLEKIIADLAYEKQGAAYLINGQYGTGKSHLLLLLHLLAALPSAWGPYLEAHRSFSRFAEPFGKHHWMVVHFSLDEYPPACPLEEAVRAEVERTLGEAELMVPEDWLLEARVDAWMSLQELCAANGYTGPLILLDELSLFLAGKSPTAREADAAFLQFLAGWCTRSPCRLIGAAQRHLGDTGALPTHSWRQVEDRFRRFTLSPQQLVDVAHNKLIEQTDAAGTRAIVVESLLPTARALGLNMAVEEVMRHWPFHPAALSLLVKVVNAHLSPHRGVIEGLQRLPETALLERPVTRFITALDLHQLIDDDLRTFHGEYRLWPALTHLLGCATDAPDPTLARELLSLLTIMQLADSSVTVTELRALLFNGEAAPDIADISANLHYLRRHAPYLAVTRDAELANERFSIAADDDIGAQARAHMEERRQTFTPDDPRPLETAIAACTDPAWPFATLAENRLTVLWNGVPRTVNIELSPTLTAANSARAIEGLLAGNSDAQLFMGWPGATEADICTKNCPPNYAGVLCWWIPRPPHRAERELWSEYTAWRLTADDPLPAAATRERRIRARAQEAAGELQAAVTASIRAIYLEGQWQTACGVVTALRPAEKLQELLAQLLAPGFDTLFCDYPGSAVTPPPRTVLAPMIAQFLTPGAVELPPQSLLGDYLERYAAPLGIVSFTGNRAQLTPPADNIQLMLNVAVLHAPQRLEDAARALGRPPLGLSSEQGRLAVLAAIRCGTLRGLDALMQLAPMEARLEDIIYCTQAEEIDPRFTPVLARLAGQWNTPDGTPSITVENAIREWVKSVNERLPAFRQQQNYWSAMLSVMPWGWTNTERKLTTFTELRQSTTFTAQLEILRDDPTLIAKLDAALHAGDWWGTHSAQLRVLLALPASLACAADLIELRTTLATGEACFGNIEKIDAHSAKLWAHYADAYHCWHEATFGVPVVNELRAVFQSAGFQAVKRLAVLPWATNACAPSAVLDTARAGYCPGVFTDFATTGVCSRCRLPINSPTPMPVAAQVSAEVATALQHCAAQLSASEWVDEVKSRIPHIPQYIAPQVNALLAWRLEDGAAQLLATLDDATIHWLRQPTRPTSSRPLPELETRLRGRQLTLGEAKTTLLTWLDPTGEMKDDEVILFE